MKRKTIEIRSMGGIIATAAIHKHLSVCGVPGFALHTSHFCLLHPGKACYRVSHISTGFSIPECRADAKTAIRAALAFAKKKGGKPEVLRVLRKARKMIKALLGREHGE